MEQHAHLARGYLQLVGDLVVGQIFDATEPNDAGLFFGDFGKDGPQAVEELGHQDPLQRTLDPLSLLWNGVQGIRSGCLSRAFAQAINRLSGRETDERRFPTIDGPCAIQLPSSQKSLLVAIVRASAEWLRTRKPVRHTRGPNSARTAAQSVISYSERVLTRVIDGDWQSVTTRSVFNR